VTKSHVPMHNAPERVEIPKLTNGTPAPVQRPKRTRNPVSQIPSTRGRLTKKDKRDLSQPVTEAPSQKRGSQLRPGTSTESPVHGIPDLNVPIEGPSSGDVSTHIGAEKLKDLAPIMVNTVEQEVARDAPHDELAINYKYRRVNEPSNDDCRHYLC
jgi:hypothetical protein